MMEEVGATLGETQRFECQVIGFPTPTIRWYKDEVDITNNERYHVDYEQELGVITLVIRNVTLADEGLYQCRAENSEGYATTTAYLVVKGLHSSSLDASMYRWKPRDIRVGWVRSALDHPNMGSRV